MMDIIINCLALYGFFAVVDDVGNKAALGEINFRAICTGLCSVGTMYIVFTGIKHY